MFFPEALFLLSARDQQVTWIDPVITRIDLTLAALSVNVVFTVPLGRVLILQHCESNADPGAAQNVVLQQIHVQHPSGAPQARLKRNDVPGAADATMHLDWQGSILVPERWEVRSVADFNALVAANSTQLTVIGALIPIGNIQRL